MMLDESAAVAGKLTGVWKFKCPKCDQTHRQASAIKRCAAKFAHVLLGNDVRLSLPNPLRISEYAAAKKGILPEWDAIQERLPGGGFDIPVETYIRAETIGEATLLMLQEFQRFIAKAADSYRQVEQDSQNLREKVAKNPAAVLGPAVMTGQGWEPHVAIDGREFNKLDVIKYYLDSVPKPNPDAELLRSSTRVWVINLLAVEPDADLVVFACENKHYGIKVVNGVGKLVSLKGKTRKTGLKELMDA